MFPAFAGEESRMPTAGHRMPAVFIGHGSPRNAIATNRYTEAWRAFFRPLRPRAAIVISAHWYVGTTRVTVQPRPRTVHDFVSSKGVLDRFEYPAPGDVELAHRVRDLLAPIPVELDRRWGYDHGAWVVLPHAFPDADVPVIELSLDRTQPPAFHYALGRALDTLRDEGVVLIGSGNIIHNLDIGRDPASDRPRRVGGPHQRPQGRLRVPGPLAPRPAPEDGAGATPHPDPPEPVADPRGDEGKELGDRGDLPRW